MTDASWTDVSFAALDVQTTTKSFQWSYVCEIAGVAVRGGAVDEGDRYETLINPGRPITKGATGRHGITNLMVVDAPRFWKQEPPLRFYLMDKVVVMHYALPNIQGLQKPMRGYKFPAALDSALLARELRQSDHGNSLEELVREYGFEKVLRENYKGAREAAFDRAYFNALATAHVFVALVRHYLPQNVTLAQLMRICGVQRRMI